MIYDSKEFVGNIIKNARKKYGYTQSLLSEKIGMSEKNLGNIENGKQYPLLNNFLRILEVLNLSVEDFGVNSAKVNNTNKEKLLEKIYCLNEDEALHFLDILKSVESLKKLK